MRKNKVLKLVLALIILCLFVLFSVFLFSLKKNSNFSPSQTEASINSLNQKMFDFELANPYIPQNQNSSIVISEGGIVPQNGKQQLKLNYVDDYIQEDFIKNSRMENTVFRGYFYDGLESERGMQIRVSNGQGEEYFIGLNTNINKNNYIIRPGNTIYSYLNTGISRTMGWHKVEINITPSGTYGVLDDVNLMYLPSNNNSHPINSKLTFVTDFGVAVTWGMKGSYYFDNFEIQDININNDEEQKLITHDFENSSNLDLNSNNLSNNTSILGNELLFPQHGNRMLMLNYENDYVISEFLSGDKQYSDVSIKGFFYDDMGTNEGSQVRVSNNNGNEYIIANKTSTNISNYVLRAGNINNNFIDTGVSRSKGWHEVIIRVSNIGTYAVLDGHNLAYIENGAGLNKDLTTIDNYGVAATWSAQGNYYFDNFTMTSIKDNKHQAYLLSSIQKYINNIEETNIINNISSLSYDPISQKKLNIIDDDCELKYGQCHRLFGNIILAKALLCKESGYVNQCENEIIQLIHSLLKNENYSKWKAQKTSDHFLYSPSPLTAYPVGLAFFIIQDGLDSNNQYHQDVSGLVKSRLMTEANFWAQYPENKIISDSIPGNSNSEELAWTSSFLSLYGQMYNNEEIQNKAEMIMNKSLALDLQNQKSASSSNSFLFHNHNMINPAYAVYTMGSLSEALLPYKLNNQNYMVINSSNFQLFETVNFSYIDNKVFRYSNDSFIKYGGKDDWYRSPDTSATSAYAFLANLNYKDYSSKYSKLVEFRIDTDQDNFLPYSFEANEIPQVGNPNYVIDKNREIVNSTQALYDSIAYLWMSN